MAYNKHMGFLFSLIAILGDSSGKTLDKLNFSKNRITFRQMMLVGFLGMGGSLLVFILLTKQPFPRLSLISLGLVILVALVSFGNNIFDTLSLKADDLSLREPMVDFEPILAGLVGYALFPAERKPLFLVAFVLGALIVYWGTHRRKLRRLQKKGMMYMLLAALLYAFLPSIYKITLAYLSPAYIAFFRIASILVLTNIFLPVKKVGAISRSKWTYGLLAGLIYAIEAIASLYAIKSLGVVLTMVILMLGPALRYWSSYFILKEEVRMGEMVSSFMLTAVVLVAVVK